MMQVIKDVQHRRSRKIIAALADLRWRQERGRRTGFWLPYSLPPATHGKTQCLLTNAQLSNTLCVHVYGGTGDPLIALQLMLRRAHPFGPWPVVALVPNRAPWFAHCGHSTIPWP